MEWWACVSPGPACRVRRRAAAACRWGAAVRTARPPCPYPTMPPPPVPRAPGVQPIPAHLQEAVGGAVQVARACRALLLCGTRSCQWAGQPACHQACVLSDPTAMPPLLCAGTRACCGPSPRSGTRLTPRASRPCGETTACWCAGRGSGVATGQQQPRVAASGTQAAPPGFACLAPPRCFCRC